MYSIIVPLVLLSAFMVPGETATCVESAVAICQDTIITALNGSESLATAAKCTLFSSYKTCAMAACEGTLTTEQRTVLEGFLTTYNATCPELLDGNGASMLAIASPLLLITAIALFLQTRFIG